jgi:membrane protein
MHATPQRLHDQERGPSSQLRALPSRNTLRALILRFLGLLWRALLRAFEHDAFAIAKASAYSSILTFFPGLLVVGASLASSHGTQVYLREISYAVSRILPAGGAAALAYLRGSTERSVSLLFTTSLLTVWLASGVIVSWMEGFRHAYELPKIWGLVKERLIAVALVILAGIPLTFATVLVAFGSRIETIILFHLDREFGFYVLLMWAVLRWMIAVLTSIAVIALIYHNAVPRTQPWPSVLPGSILATGMWFLATMLFGWYLQRYADYSILYGSLGVAIALLVWMYMISLIILVGAEFNAMLFPRTRLGRELTQMASRAPAKP